MRGFPIRTSSDHGSFANSPRLIAGYHVLLRLLVPRHPPCALKNLTKDILIRCSRPLCSSQTTNDPRSPAGAYPLPSSWRFVRPTGPVMKQPPSRAVPSGPNSVPGRPPEPAVRVPSRRSTDAVPAHMAAVVDVPPSSTTPDAFGRGMASAHPIRRPGVRCSLERR